MHHFTSLINSLIGISTTFFIIFALNSCQKAPTTVQYGPDIYVPDTTFKVVGYLNANSFDRFDSIDISPLTYLNLAFANPDTAGNLLFRGNKDIKPIVKSAHEQDIKVMVSLAGGGGVEPEVWTKVCRYEMRPIFIKSILDYVLANDLDGVDVDIEWNLLPYLDSLYTAFVLDLREALHSEGKAITTALQGVNLDPAVTKESLMAYDFINIMVYDKPLDSIGSHSPYSYAVESYEYWTGERGIPADRLVLGMPFYGYDFVAKRHRLYRDVVEEDTLNAYKDQVGSLFYNGIPTIVKKTELAKEKLNGVMFWELTQDTNDEYSLLRAVDRTLKEPH